MTENTTTEVEKGKNPLRRRVYLLLLIVIAIAIGSYAVFFHPASKNELAIKTVPPAAVQEVQSKPNPVYFIENNEDGEDDLDEDLTSKDDDEDDATGKEEPEAKSDD